MKKPLRREQAAVAIAALLELAETESGVTPFEDLSEENQEYAKDIAANLINLVDALRGEV